jgi:hypothetical protein
MDNTTRTTEERRRDGGRRGWLRAGLAALALLAAACGDKGPNDPVVEKDVFCPESQVTLCTTPAVAPVARDATSDGMTRSLLGIENATGRAALESALRDLEKAIASNNITQAQKAYASSRTALGSAGGQPGDAPDLGAIELLLDHVGPLIGK